MLVILLLPTTAPALRLLRYLVLSRHPVRKAVPSLRQLIQGTRLQQPASLETLLVIPREQWSLLLDLTKAPSLSLAHQGTQRLPRSILSADRVRPPFRQAHQRLPAAVSPAQLSYPTLFPSKRPSARPMGISSSGRPCTLSTLRLEIQHLLLRSMSMETSTALDTTSKITFFTAL